MSPVASAALKVALAGGAVIAVLVRTRGIPREEMGLIRPPLLLTLLFLVPYLAWMLITDAVIHWRGPWDWQPWIDAPVLASAFRISAVCFLGPAAEELIFRGWFFGLLQSRIGTAQTVLLTAAGWSLLHYTYAWPVIFVIFVDGIFLGLARWKTRSVIAPIIMHMLYNLYAIW